MLDNLEHNRRTGNGRDGPIMTVMPSTGLGNTNPTATLGSTGLGAAVVVHGKPGVGKTSITGQMLECMADNVLLIQAGADLVVRSAKGVTIIQAKEADRGKPLKVAGQVVLFRKVMEDWGFDEKEAATLLGFEDGSDVREIYLGLKPVGHRDANDRLRAVLRIAADLDALFQDVGSIRDWLNEPQQDLGGKTPRSLLNEGSMENLLRVKYYVVHLSGRQIVLEALPKSNLSREVRRFANLTHLALFATREGLTIDEVTDVIAFDRDDVTRELMDGPFERKPALGNKFGKPSRFSDGQWPVFYAAIERDTAAKESTYHYGRKAAMPMPLVPAQS